jgi:hypothetical protein
VEFDTLVRVVGEGRVDEQSALEAPRLPANDRLRPADLVVGHQLDLVTPAIGRQRCGDRQDAGHLALFVIAGWVTWLSHAP